MLSVLLLATSLTSVSAPNVSMQISGLPSDAQPSVRVTLPSGSVVTVTDPSAFNATETGTYRWTPEPVRAPGQIVDTIYEGPSGEASIGDTGGTLSVTYAPRGGTGMLWISTNRIDDDDDATVGTIRAFRNGDLIAGNISGPSREFRRGPRLSGSGFDANGNFYFADGWDDPGIFRISPAGLASNGTAAKAGGLENHVFAFDPQGNLWTASWDRAIRVPAAGLAAGNFSPNLTLTTQEEPYYGEMVFNHAGDMILVGNDYAWIVPAADLSRGLAARREITFSSGGLRQAAIDAEGNLWAAGVNGVVIQISAADLGRSGAVTAREYPLPEFMVGVAVDNEGGIWALAFGGEIFRLAPGGSAFEAKGTVGKGLDDWTRLSFNPPAVGTPLAQMPGLPTRQ